MNLTAENWKTYVGYQPTDPNSSDTASVMGFYLNRGDGIKIEHFVFTPDEIVMTLDDLLPQINDMLSTFPEIVIKSAEHLEEEKNKIQPSAANTNLNNSWYYCGHGEIDHPIIVISKLGKYAIFKHPKFDNYGFTVKKIEE